MLYFNKQGIYLPMWSFYEDHRLYLPWDFETSKVERWGWSVEGHLFYINSDAVARVR